MVIFSNNPGIVVKPKSPIVLRKLDGATSAERVENGKNQMVETVRDAKGNVLKKSIFTDRDGDGRYDQNEVISVKYFDITSNSITSQEYLDNNGDGLVDEFIESDGMGNEVIQKINKRGGMSKIYGSTWERFFYLGRAKDSDN